MTQAPTESMAAARDSRLLARMVAGDDTALAEVYDAYGAYVYGLASRVLRDTRLAEDVTQEVFVSMWQRPEAFDPACGTLRAWLGVITHRRAVDLVRKERAARERDEREATRREVPPEDVADAATDSVIAAHVRDAVAALPADQRRAIELAYFGGNSFREVARLLDVPEGTAKSRLRLGLGKLAATLASRGVIP